ncbi:MAG: PD-(D/E)XK nuclease family protein [Lachnospiraceae bacterium]|nr:PD-(D/E)XK nuclease family protein [Lachnospiraceae bacterium]
MLHIIEGTAGSGKTTKAYELLLEGAARSREKTYILVIPEQSSISAQKDIIEMSPRKGILNIDILSFNRLAHRIFEAAGGEASGLIDDSGKNLIIRYIADDIIDKLTVLKSGLKKTGCIAEVRSVISEFMQYGISPEDIPQIAENAYAASPYLARKLQDVALIYTKFREYMGSEFMTREELLVRASAEAKNAPFLKDSILIFDSFTGFTPVQYMFMETLLSRCEDIYVCLTRSAADGRGSLFSLGDQSKEKLEAIAERHGGIDEIRLEGDRRHSVTSDIGKLGASVFSLAPAGQTAGDGSVLFRAAEEPYAETRAALRHIAELVRDRGWHYRDCAILMGDTALYADIVRSEARSLKVPVYVDQTRHIGLNPFTELIRSVLLVLKENYSYDSVFHLLRSGLTDIKTDDIDIAENYILAVGIKGASAYSKPFTAVFRGISGEARLAAERVREGLSQLLAPVCDKALSAGDFPVHEMIAAIRDICGRLKVEEKLSRYVESFEKNGDPERAIEYSQIYDILNSQFDNMDSLIGGQRVSIQEFSELYEDALSEIRVGVIPPKSDVVMAGDLTRSRFGDIRALFFIGMTEGAVPAAGNKGGLISDSDRRLLQSIGVEVAPAAAENAEKEKFYFYMNLMKPKELVCFSRPFMSLDGTANRESYFMKEARRCLGAGDALCPTETDKKNSRFYSEDDLLASFAESLEADGEAAALYLKAIEESGAGGGAVDAITGACAEREKTEVRLTKEAGQMIFGESYIESPTELERFASCPYGHFLGYGLKLRERRHFEFELRDMGTLLHRVLELFSRRLTEEGLSFRTVSDDKAAGLLEGAIKDASEEDRISSLISSGARHAYTMERLKRYAYRSIDTLRYQSKQGSFDSVYFEKIFSHAGLKGTIDRCDEAVTPAGIFIDVIDYKSGNKSFDPDRIYNGLDIQLPLYMSAALDMRSEVSDGGIVRPAGLFYYHVDDPLVEGERESTEDKINEAVRKELRLRGVANADMEAVKAFDREIADKRRSLVIPAGFKRDGSPEASAKLYTEEELKGLLSHTMRLTDELRRDIAGGDVSRSPYSLGGSTGCDYCAYKEICDGGRKRILAKRVFPEAWTDK